VGRFGGEEFLVILAGCDEIEALTRADQIREAVTAAPIPTVEGPIAITISLGVLSVREWGPLVPEEILREVDNALYEAKRDGRNRCKLALPTVASRLQESATNAHS
jgi:diguanylate cyclase (GGDEF)-like protein